MERSTRQRSAIKDALHNAGRPLLAQEVLDLAVAGPMLGSGYVLDLPSERRGER